MKVTRMIQVLQSFQDKGYPDLEVYISQDNDDAVGNDFEPVGILFIKTGLDVEIDKPGLPFVAIERKN